MYLIKDLGSLNSCQNLSGKSRNKMKQHCKIGLKSILGKVLVTFALLSFTLSFSQGDAAAPLTESQLAGEGIFQAECVTCHYFSVDKTGPALSGVVKRQGRAWLTKWIDNPQKVINSGDKHATEMLAKYGAVMPALGLTPDEINQVIDYLEVGKDPAAAVAAAPAPGDAAAGPVASDGGMVNNVLIVVLVVLALIIALLVLLSSVITKQLKQKEENGDLDPIDSEYVNQKHSLISVLKSPTFLGLAGVILLLLGAWFGVTKGLYAVGVQQGYQPVQPIAFSHKLHAGEHQIDCNYCHTGVRKAKSANIPAASICMNCHVKIKTESERIQQIYKAIDYNPETREFGQNIKPIEWVRIHNLPDHVYFNHAQHTKVAGLECENCHGPIDEMEVVYQYSPLTMGWCIDCHRETKVSHATDNDYYENLLKAHEEAGGDASEMTVEDIGGLECGKCHY